MNSRRAVSEVIGTLILVGVVMIGIVLVGILLLSNPLPSKVPVFDSIISNRSETIYMYHKGGDPLIAGQYRILVDGGDQTGNFTIMSPGTEPWSVGETLSATSPTMPRHVVIILNQSGGGATVLASQYLFGSGTLQDPNTWYFNPAGTCSWKYRKKITIDHTGVAADQSSFPVLVSLTDTDLSKAQGDGDDILFTSSDGSTRLPHEIENFTASTGSLVAWVGVPSLSSSTDTVLYMYYGNSTATSQQDPAGVWDANFMAVWHYDSNFVDSTSNPNDGTDVGTSDAAGMVAHARDCDGSSSYVQMAASASINDLFAGGGTFSAWIYPHNRGEGTPDGGRIGDKSNSYSGASGWGFGTYGTLTDVNVSLRKGFSTTDGHWCSPTGSIPLNAWSHVVVTYDDTSAANNPTMYINGVPVSVTRMTTPSGSPETDASQNMRIGSHAGANQRDFDGIIDEIRASDTIRSDSWIATEYSNQNSPSSFYTIGGEEQWQGC
ncbi:MAG: DUF2341 domain-containing protein [Methanomicrobiales archaeon]|nr:DUF2341 domain-containing protein [Methanomicrobiales archaeon]